MGAHPTAHALLAPPVTTAAVHPLPVLQAAQGLGATILVVLDIFKGERRTAFVLHFYSCLQFHHCFIVGCATEPRGCCVHATH